MRRRFAFTVAFLGLASALVLAQTTGMARGKVQDDQGQGIQDAKILIEFKGGITRSYETKTNKKGEFSQIGLQPGVYRFTASKDGFRPAFIEVKVALGDPTYIGEIKLEKAQSAAAAGAADPGVAALKATFEKAIQATQEGRLDEAEALYKEALTKYPQIQQLHHNLGIVYGLKKDYVSAEAAMLKALEIRPDYVEAAAALSGFYLASGQPAKAQELLTKMSADRPTDPRPLFQLGVVFFHSGQPDAAVPVLNRVAEMDPSNAEVHYYLGSIAIGQNKIAECASEMEKYLASQPTNAQMKATAEGLLAACKPKK